MSRASDRSTPKRYIRAARVVTASAKGVIEDGAVAVEGSRIAAVGPAAR
jgi:imidazolonepropionase-like amidohydrolase